MSVRSLRYNTIEQHFTKSALASTDRDALAFLEAAQIYNTNDQRAIVNLVRSLKRTGLWSKMKAIYPFIGGTATSHKWNLKDPRDVDAAFRLQFFGGWTHSSTGALPNGTTAYADTFLNANTNLTYLSWALSYYSRTNDNTVVQAEIRCYLDGQPNRSLMLRAGRGYLGCDFPDINFATQSTSLGYWIGTTRSATDRELYYNGVSETTSTANLTTAAPNAKLFLGAANDRGVAALYSRKQCAFSTIGDGLTDSEASALYNIVDLYQKRLGRAV